MSGPLQSKTPFETPLQRRWPDEAAAGEPRAGRRADWARRPCC